MTPEELLELKNARTDDVALAANFDRYVRIPRSLMRQFYLRGFERADWYQEARIAHYKAVLSYSGNLGSQFGSFYKMVLKSHYNSIVRHALAQKRAGELQTKFYNLNTDEDLWLMTLGNSVQNEVEREYHIRLGIEELWNDLTQTEAHALRQTLQGNEVTTRRHRQAMRRVHTKMIQYLYV